MGGERPTSRITAGEREGQGSDEGWVGDGTGHSRGHCPSTGDTGGLEER